jgi:hypothetical protein
MNAPQTDARVRNPSRRMSHSFSTGFPVCPSPSGNFGEEQSGTGLGKVELAEGPSTVGAAAFPLEVRFREGAVIDS